MIPPTPGADPASRLFGYASPPDGAGPIGPDQYWPQPLAVSRQELLGALNPLHHVPGVGMIYRAATGDTIPAPLRILGAGLVGGPLGALGAAFVSLVEALFRMGPDLSRPSSPAGLAATGSEAGMQPVSPGTLGPDAYLTLATTQPEFLQGSTQFAQGGVIQGDPTRGAAAYQQAAADEMQRAQMTGRG